MVTVILVGVKWLPAYYLLSINFLLYIFASLWAVVAGFTAEETCKTAQSGRATFLQVQLATLFLYATWFMLPAVVFKINDSMFKPDDVDDEGKLIYGSWTHKQFAEEEEEDDD